MNSVRVIEHRWGDHIDRNSQYRLIRDVPCYEVVGTKPSNCYYGASQIYTQNVRPITLQRGTEIQFLCGGDFMLEGGVRVEILSSPPDEPFTKGHSYGGDSRSEREREWLKLLDGKVVEVPLSASSR